MMRGTLFLSTFIYIKQKLTLSFCFLSKSLDITGKQDSGACKTKERGSKMDRAAIFGNPHLKKTPPEIDLIPSFDHNERRNLKKQDEKRNRTIQLPKP